MFLVRSSISSPFIFRHTVNWEGCYWWKDSPTPRPKTCAWRLPPVRKVLSIHQSLPEREWACSLRRKVPFFFTHASSLFPVWDLWEFLHNLIIFFFNSIKKFFLILFIPYKSSVCLLPGRLLRRVRKNHQRYSNLQKETYSGPEKDLYRISMWCKVNATTRSRIQPWELRKTTSKVFTLLFFELIYKNGKVCHSAG